MSALLEHDECIARLAAAVEAFADVAADADPNRPVSTCPGWAVSDLVAHLGDVHRWATRAILDKVSVSRPIRPGPADHLDGWFRQGAADLLTALRSTPVDEDVWTFGAPPHRVTFWSRRQLHEATMHLWDLQFAFGEPTAIDDLVARDGIDEVIHVMVPRQVRLGRTSAPTHTLALDDGTERWWIGPDGEPQAVVRGSAPELLLLLWKRRGLDEGDFELDGDEAVARAVLAHKLTP